MTKRNFSGISKEPSRKIDAYLSFVNESFCPSVMDEPETAQVHLLCTNHNLPHHLPFGGIHPKLQFIKEGFGVFLHSLMPFSAPSHLPKSNGFHWQLISHLTLNHLSFSDSLYAKDMLQEILHLYSFSHSEANIAVIHNIDSLEVKPLTARGNGHYSNAVLRGSEITLTFKQHQPNLFLFSSILEKFFSSYCALNSFTKLVVRYADQPRGTIQWTPKTGSKPLL